MSNGLVFSLCWQIPLGVIFKDENINEDMLEILHRFHGYLPQQSGGQIDGQIFTGDQLTEERAVNVISSVANGLTPFISVFCVLLTFLFS